MNATIKKNLLKEFEEMPTWLLKEFRDQVKSNNPKDIRLKLMAKVLWTRGE